LHLATNIHELSRKFKEYFDIYRQLIGGDVVICPPKFYYWEKREQEFSGVKVRMYIYPAFSCGQELEKNGAGITMDFGVAEVYFEGKFVGLILNLGGGVVVPMPHPVKTFERLLDPYGLGDEYKVPL